MSLKQITQPSSAEESFFVPGTVFWYRMKGRIYGGAVLGEETRGGLLIALSQELEAVPSCPEDVLSAPAYTAAWFADAFLLPRRRLHALGAVPVSGKYIRRSGLRISEDGSFKLSNCGQKQTWAHTFRAWAIPDACVRDYL